MLDIFQAAVEKDSVLGDVNMPLLAVLPKPNKDPTLKTVIYYIALGPHRSLSISVLRLGKWQIQKCRDNKAVVSLRI